MENERIVISRRGPPSVLTLVREPAPVPQRGEVRIRVEAAGVAFGDVAQRSGAYVGRAPSMPYTPGYDVVGTVDAVAGGVTGVVVGDRVAALTLSGGYARYVCVPVEWTVAVPQGIAATDCVALVLNYTTAWQMLRRVARVRGGEAVLVYGASGGVGTALLDIGKHLGLVVAAAAARKWHDQLGDAAALLFDDRDGASIAALRKFRPSGFDVALDPIGGSHVWRTRSIVARHGTLIAFGAASAVKPGGKRNLAPVVQLALLLAFAKVWPRPRVETYAIDQQAQAQRRELNDDLRHLIELLRAGAIVPRIGAVFPFREALRAHGQLEARSTIGKIVLVPE